MKNKLLSLMPLFLIVGCASTYSLSERGLKFRDSLTNAQAFKEVQKYAFRSSDQAGLCGAHTNAPFQKAEPVAVQEPYLVFNSYWKEITSVSTGPSGVGMSTKTSYVYRKAGFKMDLTKLNKIRILSEVEGYCVPAVPSGYVVMIGTKEMNSVMINVSKNNLENFVAALSFLSPDAKIMEGVGI